MLSLTPGAKVLQPAQVGDVEQRSRRRGHQRRPPARVPGQRTAGTRQGQGQQADRDPQGQARHRARGRGRRGAAGRHAVGEVGRAHDDAVVQGPRRIRRRARVARRAVAARLAEGRRPGRGMSEELLRDRENWLSRWREGRIGFHQDTPSPLLVECWARVGCARGVDGVRAAGGQVGRHAVAGRARA